MLSRCASELSSFCFFCLREYAHQGLTLHARRITGDARYGGIPLTKLTDCVQPHAAFCARQVFSFSKGHEGVLKSGEG